MAYDPDYLAGPYHFGGKGGTQLFSLATTDAKAAIEGAGYVSDADKREMKPGDLVIVTKRATLPSGAATGVGVYVVSAVTNGAATLIAAALT